mgnify:CR=1 FL=1
MICYLILLYFINCPKREQITFLENFECIKIYFKVKTFLLKMMLSMNIFFKNRWKQKKEEIQFFTIHGELYYSMYNYIRFMLSVKFKINSFIFMLS